MNKAEESVTKLVAFFSNAATAVEADVTHIDALLESVLVDEKEIIIRVATSRCRDDAGGGR